MVVKYWIYDLITDLLIQSDFDTCVRLWRWFYVEMKGMKSQFSSALVLAIQWNKYNVLNSVFIIFMIIRLTNFDCQFGWYTSTQHEYSNDQFNQPPSNMNNIETWYLWKVTPPPTLSILLLSIYGRVFGFPLSRTIDSVDYNLFPKCEYSVRHQSIDLDISNDSSWITM